MVGSIVVGILAGYIASKLTSGEGKGCLTNLFLGLVGSLVGGWLFGLLGIEWSNGWIGELGTSVVGAVALLWTWNRIK